MPTMLAIVRYVIEASVDEVVSANLVGKRYTTEQEAMAALVKAGVFGRVVRARYWVLG